jgi:hypothetical protein
VSEILKSVEIIVRREQFLAFDAERLADSQRLVRYTSVKAQQVVEFVGR